MTPLELQFNGYRGVDFNTDDLSLPAMQKACAALKADGGGRMLATVITDQLDRMVARIERLAEFHAADAHIRDAIAGIHVEGPFISPLPGYVGAHPAKHVLPAEVSAAQRLVDAGRGLVRMLTLAPEHGSGRTEVRNCPVTVPQAPRSCRSTGRGGHGPRPAPLLDWRPGGDRARTASHERAADSQPPHRT